MPARPAILCVTPNPSVDRTLVVSGFLPGRVWRADTARLTCGGKGVNVARAVAALGGRALCAGPLGGATGRLASDLAAAETWEPCWTRVEGETRANVIIVDPGSGAATVINETGPTLSPVEWEHLLAEIATKARSADVVCISGSLPPAPPPGAMTRLIIAAKERGPVWVDASGAALIEAMAASPAGIKINAWEASEALGLGLAIATPLQAVRAARAIQARGIPRVLITLGADGAVMVTPQAAWHARPPVISAVNAVGAGDAVLGGLLMALVQGLAGDESLRRAVAAGTTATLASGTGEFNREMFDGTLPFIVVTTMNDRDSFSI